MLPKHVRRRCATPRLDLTLGVDIDFRVKFYEKLVVVPRGGGTRNIQIKVVPK